VLINDAGGNITGIIPWVLQTTGLQRGPLASPDIQPSEEEEVIPLSKLRLIDTSVNSFVVRTEGGLQGKEVFRKIREGYGVIVHQSGDGFVNIITPSYLLSSSSGLLGISAWDFELGRNAYEIQYGDLTSKVNSVIVVGFPPVVGMAVDPIGLSLNSKGNTPQPYNYNYLTFYNYDLKSEIQCNRVAKEKLLELERNNTISFQTRFDPRFMVFQPLTFRDNDRFSGEEIFFIKKFNVNISKENVSCTITAFNHSLTTLPNELVISDTGIADVDVLGIREKALDNAGWRNLDGL
jgi:hypothetical protein